MIEKKINLLERKSTHLWLIFIALFLNMNVLNWGISQFEKWNLLNSNIFIRMLIVEMASLLLFCENKKKVDEQIVENCIEIDRSEDEENEFIHESCIFS